MLVEDIDIALVVELAATIVDLQAPDAALDIALFDLAADGRYWPDFKDLWEHSNMGSRIPRPFTGSVDAALALAFALAPEAIADIVVGAGESIRSSSQDRRVQLPISIVSSTLGILRRRLENSLP